MKSILTHITALFLLLVVSLMPTTSHAADKPHAVIVVGTHHYSPELSMPLLATELERLGFTTEVIIPNGDPEMDKNGEGIPGLEALESADVAIFFMRFLTLRDSQLEHITKYTRAGKPIVAFRTSTHSFNYPSDHKNKWLNLGFGQYVLGTQYIVHMSGPTQVEVLETAKKHPILTGVTETNFESPGTLYLTSLQPGCEPLLLGSGSRSGTRMVNGQFGTHFITENEQDIVAWTFTNHYKSKVFSTSLGHVGDFANPSAMRIMINGICWAADHPIPKASDKINTFNIADPRAKKKK